MLGVALMPTADGCRFGADNCGCEYFKIGFTSSKSNVPLPFPRPPVRIVKHVSVVKIQALLVVTSVRTTVKLAHLRHTTWTYNMFTT